VVLEGFDNRANPAAQLISLEYMGIVKLYCVMYDIPLIEQGPSMKEWTTDEKLYALDLWFKGLKHSRDAARHLVRYLAVKEKHMGILLAFKDKL
jgi:hypothetical protein